MKLHATAGMLPVPYLTATILPHGGLGPRELRAVVVHDEPVLAEPYLHPMPRPRVVIDSPRRRGRR